MTAKNRAVPFKAETQQLLEILINSLYSDRDVFLRELISNASDAITKMNYVMLTDHNVVDPDAAPEIRIYADKTANTLKITDTGIGMNADELAQNLGTIAHSGAKSFLEAAKDNKTSISDLIGQFGVGFYAAFMVSDSIEVLSRSYRLDDTAAKWTSKGVGTFIVSDAEKEKRGTEIFLHLKEDAKDYTDENKLKEIIRKHSNYIPFPIYVGDEKEKINAAETVWRKNPKEVSEDEYKNFYQNFTMDFMPPMKHLHLSIDAPVQMYALLYIPSSPDKTMFSARKEDGLQLYARKVLIQDYCTDLLPRYYRFIEGVIDSEDIPLNVSRETMQASRIILSLKKVLSGKVTEMLKTWGTTEPDKYTEFWKKFGYFLSEGIITDPDAKGILSPLLRFQTMNHGVEYHSLDDYVKEMKPDQKKIYYVLGDNLETLRVSPHTEDLREKGYDVLLLTQTYDPFLVTTLDKYNDFQIVNAASASDEEKPAEEKKEDDKPAEENKPVESTDEEKALIDLFKSVLGDSVTDVRITKKLVSSPARLVNPTGAIPQEMEKMYEMMREDFTESKKILEINPNHPLIKKLVGCQDNELKDQVIHQVYDGARLMEGESTNTAAMLERVQNMMIKLMEK